MSAGCRRDQDASRLCRYLPRSDNRDVTSFRVGGMEGQRDCQHILDYFEGSVSRLSYSVVPLSVLSAVVDSGYVLA